MSYNGDIRLGDTLDFHFTTRQISGAPFTLAGTPVLSAYPANSTTQLTAGITLDVDFDAVTGLNHARIVASSGNGYATATDYSVVITAGTVNSVSVVGEVIGSFSIEHRSALMPTTPARTLVVDAAGLGDANMVKAGASGAGNTITTSGGVTLPAATIASTTNITAGTITTATNLTNAPTSGDFTATMKTSLNAATPASVTGAVGSVTGNVGGNVNGSVGSVFGAVGSVTGNVGGSIGGNVVGSVGSVSSVTNIVSGVLTTQVTESYRANGAAPTLAQALCETLGQLGEQAIASTTKTVKKFDHTTTAETFTLDSATAPTSITRAS